MVGQRVRNYVILRELGQGGMGVVYEAMREDINRRAALKILRPEYSTNEEVAARFLNEARATNLIEHPGIVKAFDFGREDNGTIFLAMEFLEGETLDKRLKRIKKFSEAETARLGRQIAAALSAAHMKKVIHRDLKPENIFIVPEAEAPGGERTKILDFGLAKMEAVGGSVRTGTNLLMGTPVYMSPEQCRSSKNANDRSDVYALGTILFEMLAGRTPFVATEPGEYIGMHLYERIPPLGSLMPDVSAQMQTLVDSMLSKAPEQRPAMNIVEVALRELSADLSEGSAAWATVKGRKLPPSIAAMSGRHGAMKAGESIDLYPSANPLAATDPAGLPYQALKDLMAAHNKTAELKSVPSAKTPGSASTEVEALPRSPSNSTPRAGEQALMRAKEVGKRIRDAQRNAEAGGRRSLFERRARLRLVAMTSGVFLLILIPLVALLLRRPGDRGRTTATAQPPKATETKEVSAKAVPVAPPVAPPQPAAPPLPKEVASAVAQAERLARIGAVSGAIKELRRSLKSSNHPALWCTMGQLACRKANVRLANESLRNLEGDQPGRELARSELLLVCKTYDILEGKDGKLILVSSLRDQKKDPLRIQPVR